MSNKKTYDQKHLTTTQRIKIEKGLNDQKSFAEIARIIDKHPSTVIKEVKKYRFLPPRKDPKPLRCAKYNECQMRFLCDKDCIRLCKNCFDAQVQLPKCNVICPDYLEPPGCPQIAKAPYVCNGCKKTRHCLKQHTLLL